MGDIRTIRNRIIAGLFVLKPLFITFAIIRWLDDTLHSLALGLILSHLKSRWLPSEDEASFLLDSLFSLTAFVLILAFFFVAGMFFRSGIHRSIYWILLNVPGVSFVYSAVNKVFQAISNSQNSSGKLKRIVLVAFPHPGMKAPAIVSGGITVPETVTYQTEMKKPAVSNGSESDA